MTKYILKSNETIDDAYQRIAGQENLFNAAFFGHKALKKDKQKLNYIWNKLIKQDAKRKSDY